VLDRYLDSMTIFTYYYIIIIFVYTKSIGHWKMKSNSTRIVVLQVQWSFQIRISGIIYLKTQYEKGINFVSILRLIY